MTTPSDLLSKKCAACEGGVPKLEPDRINELLAAVPQWRLSPDGGRISRTWRVKDFADGLTFIQAVGRLAEDEGHHPDLHLTDYRNLAIELWTHAVGGLTENDFILAAKVDALPQPALK